ncbi:hypothetical protein V6N13_094358 [Hibiscus sabdariffa]
MGGVFLKPWSVLGLWCVLGYRSCPATIVAFRYGNIRPSCFLSDMFWYVKEKQSFTVSLSPMIDWRWIRDGRAWKGVGSDYKIEEVKWWVEVVASSETMAFSI